LFSTVTDTFLSIVGVAILLVCANTVFSGIFNSVILNKIISYISLILFVVFFIAGLIFGKENEDVFYISFLIFLLLCGVIFLLYGLKALKKSISEAIQIYEIEKRCRSCEFFEECEECFLKDCPCYIEASFEEAEYDVE